MDNQQLQMLVEQISVKFFNKPFLHEARFNNRLRTTGGRYLLNSHAIEVNKKQLDTYGMDAVIDIIKHELCHYHLHLEYKGYRHRDKDFKELCRQVGAPRFCQALPEAGRVTYKCVNCGVVYNRKRKINTAKYCCGQCRGRLEPVRNK